MLLRDDLPSLDALVGRAADHLTIDAAFVEKDFWVMECLRSVTAYCDDRGVIAVFKGGTSLSRAWNLIERFSEDVDLLLDFPETMGAGQRERVIKGAGECVRQHLGLDASAVTSTSSTRG